MYWPKDLNSRFSEVDHSQYVKALTMASSKVGSQKLLSEQTQAIVHVLKLATVVDAIKVWLERELRTYKTICKQRAQLNMQV